MKRYLQYLVITLVLLQVQNVSAFTIFKTCVNRDDSFSHHIVDTNILRLTNKEYYAAAIVQCINIEGRHAFSFYDSGSPLHPDSAVRFAPGSDEVCEGDTIMVYDEKCVIISINKSKLTDLSETKEKTEKESEGRPFILWRQQKKQQQLIDKIEK